MKRLRCVGFVENDDFVKLIYSPLNFYPVIRQLSIATALIDFGLGIHRSYYMASWTSGETAACDCLGSTFSDPTLSRNGPEVHYEKIANGHQ